MANGTQSDFDWRSVARAASRHSRRTIGLGEYDKERDRHAAQFYIRELSIASGGLGCAVWDGAVVLARWLFAHRPVLGNQTVLELGCGCGLPGIVAARYASHVWLTEYVAQLVRNVEYNIAVNSDYENEDDRDALERESAQANGHFEVHSDLRPHATAAFLDWFTAVPGSGDAENKIKQARCTRTTQTMRFATQPWQHCRTCFPDDTSSGVCVVCASTCHAGHDLGQVQTSRFRCDCGGELCSDTAPDETALTKEIPKVDIIIGAELTYNSLSIDALARVVDYFLKPNGVFYEVLSDNRDGVNLFIERIAQLGFTAEKRPAAEFEGKYHTLQWSRQSIETYSFYTFRRATSTFPVME